MGANFVVEYDGQDMLREEEYDEVAEIIKKVSVVNEDKVEKNANQHDKKKFGDSTAVEYESDGNGGTGNGNKRDEKKDYAQNGDNDEEDGKKKNKRDNDKRKESVNANINNYLTEKTSSDTSAYILIGLISIAIGIAYLCITALYRRGNKDKYAKYEPIMEELRKTYSSQYESTE